MQTLFRTLVILPELQYRHLESMDLTWLYIVISIQTRQFWKDRYTFALYINGIWILKSFLMEVKVLPVFCITLSIACLLMPWLLASGLLQVPNSSKGSFWTWGCFLWTPWSSPWESGIRCVFESSKVQHMIHHTTVLYDTFHVDAHYLCCFKET